MAEIIDQTAWDEAQSIVRDPNNPQYKSYHRNDIATVDRVTALLRRADPSETDISDTTPAGLRNAAADTPPSEATAQGEDAATLTQHAETLQQAFGENYQADYQLAQNHLRAMQQASGMDVSEFGDLVLAVEEKIGSVAALKLLKAAAKR